jgi:hypothetical protein
LFIYTGAYLICIDNKHLKDKVPRGNGTFCRVVSIKLRENASSYTWKNHYGKKVWTVNAKDVEWVQCEHVPHLDIFHSWNCKSMIWKK